MVVVGRETTLIMRLSGEVKFIGGVVILTVVILIGGIFFLSRGNTSNISVPEDQIVARNGLHWHPKLSVYIKGQKLELTENIGLGAVHGKLHTHTEDYKEGVVHMEIQGVVTKDDTKLGRFFQAWGKEFSSTKLFDKINGADGTVKMTVNGQENKDFNNYLMKDGDKIEVRYE